MEENDANPVSSKGVKDEDTELLEQDGSGKEVDDETFIISESEDDEKLDDEKDSASKTKGKSKGSVEIDNSSDDDEDDDLGDSDDDEDDDLGDSDDDEDDDLGDSDDDENEDEGEDDSTGEVAPILEKRKPLTNAQIEEMNKRIKNTGVVYLSTIPPGMRWTQVMQKLKELQADIIMELTRSKMSVDRLTLRQKEGFLSALPVGCNMFKEQFERVLPASSVANLYPFNYSGKTDPKGFFIGRDKYGTNILVDFDRRAEDKTNANCLILGNSGQGKSFLLKLILTNLRESGKRIISLDPEAEYEELTKALGGCYIDFMSGEFIINPLEPKSFGEADKEYDQTTPEAFRRVTRLSQHIAYLKDFFRAYKDFNDEQLDTLEIILTKLYNNFGITDYTDYDKLTAEDYPIMEDLYALLEKEYNEYDRSQKNIYREKTLQELCLGLHSMCVGTESKYFNGHTNIVDDKFLCFGVKGLLDTNRRLKDAMLFNLLSYMTNELLGKGNTVAAIDELYLFLTNMTAIEYIRNASKRVRKKDSAVILASQNIEDFMLDGIKEYTKPLFSIPTHQFLFNAGNIEPKTYIDIMQIEPSEFELIKYPERGTCLYRCGNERYLLQVIAPEFKQKMFGKAGGR